MNRIIGVSLLNCSLILVTVLVHKIVYRSLYLNYSNLFMYWGLFIGIFFILQIVSNATLKNR